MMAREKREKQQRERKRGSEPDSPSSPDIFTCTLRGVCSNEQLGQQRKYRVMQSHHLYGQVGILQAGRYMHTIIVGESWEANNYSSKS